VTILFCGERVSSMVSRQFISAKVLCQLNGVATTYQSLARCPDAEPMRCDVLA